MATDSVILPVFVEELTTEDVFVGFVHFSENTEVICAKS